MSEESACPSPRLAAQAGKRRTKGFGRREAMFELFASGHSHQEIAKAFETSPGAVRRVIDTAVAGRRHDAPERFARLQVARLSKALLLADGRLERGDIGAIPPFLKIVAELDRYYGLGLGAPRQKPTATRFGAQRIENARRRTDLNPPSAGAAGPARRQVPAPNALKWLTTRRICILPRLRGRGPCEAWWRGPPPPAFGRSPSPIPLRSMGED